MATPVVPFNRATLQTISDNNRAANPDGLLITARGVKGDTGPQGPQGEVGPAGPAGTPG